MATITGAKSLLNDTEISDESAITEALMTKIAANINYLIENHDDVGSVKTGVWTEAQFYSLGYDNTKWVLMDGRDVTGSAYHTLTGNTTIPDARGRFPRVYGSGIPGAPSVGDTQANQNKAHTHTTSTEGDHVHDVLVDTAADFTSVGIEADTVTQDVGYRQGPLLDYLSTAGAHTHTISSEGGTEARPDTVVVNAFIKID